jgi:hypothetical protein
MQTGSYYKASWGKLLVTMSIIATAIIISVPIVGLTVSRLEEGPGYNIYWLISMVALPIVLIDVTLLFIVKGFEITPDKLLIQRLLWKTEIDLTNLVNVEIDPDALKGSIRTFGNGGLYSFTGWFKSGRLGSFKAYVTQLQNCVVLRFTDKVIVISPDNPQQFAYEIIRARGLANANFQT